MGKMTPHAVSPLCTPTLFCIEIKDNSYQFCNNNLSTASNVFADESEAAEDSLSEAEGRRGAPSWSGESSVSLGGFDTDQDDADTPDWRGTSNTPDEFGVHNTPDELGVHNRPERGSKGPPIPLTDLLDARQSDAAMEQTKRLLSNVFSPCIQCPFLHRAWEVLCHASKYYDDNLSVVLNERFLLAVRLHLPHVGFLPVEREDFGLSTGPLPDLSAGLPTSDLLTGLPTSDLPTGLPTSNLPTGLQFPSTGVSSPDLSAGPSTGLPTGAPSSKLTKEELVEEARTCRTLLDTKCTLMPFDKYRFLQRFGTVMFMLCERAEAVRALTEAIRVAIEFKLTTHRGFLIPACPLVLHLLGDNFDDCFEFFLLVAQSAHKAGNTEVLDVCTRRAAEFAHTEAQQAARQRFLDSIPTTYQRS